MKNASLIVSKIIIGWSTIVQIIKASENAINDYVAPTLFYGSLVIIHIAVLYTLFAKKRWGMILLICVNITGLLLAIAEGYLNLPLVIYNTLIILLALYVAKDFKTKAIKNK